MGCRECRPLQFNGKTHLHSEGVEARHYAVCATLRALKRATTRFVWALSDSRKGCLYECAEWKTDKKSAGVNPRPTLQWIMIFNLAGHRGYSPDRGNVAKRQKGNGEAVTPTPTTLVYCLLIYGDSPSMIERISYWLFFMCVEFALCIHSLFPIYSPIIHLHLLRCCAKI